MENEAYILFGSEVKTRGNDIVDGHLVLFSTKADPDISLKRDFFTPNDTDYDLEFTDRSRVYYQHGLDKQLGTTKLGVGEMKQDDAGIWIEAQLQQRDDYEKAVFKMAKAGKLGWSSGVPAHLVRREKQDNGAHKVLYWPLGLDASLTPNPAEPRTFASVKSLLETLETEEEDFVLDDIKSERDFERFLNEKFSHRESKALIAIAKRGFVARPQREVETAIDEAALEAVKTAYLKTMARTAWCVTAQGV
jgi:phage head maturation protease